MKALVDKLTKEIPTIERLDYIAERINEEVVLKEKYVGVSDKVEGGYIRITDGEIDIQEKSFRSCSKSIITKTPYRMVLGFQEKAHGLPGYVEKVLSLMTEVRKVNVTGVELSKTKIIEEEVKDKEFKNDSYQFFAVDFTLRKTITSGGSKCIKTKCAPD